MQPSPPKGERGGAGAGQTTEYGSSVGSRQQYRDPPPGTGSTTAGGGAGTNSNTAASSNAPQKKQYNRGPKKQTAKELLDERARIDAAMEQVEAAKAKARAQRAEYGRYLKWKVDLQHKERKSREQEDIAMRKEVEEKLKLVLEQHREQAREDRNQWKKFSQAKVRKQEPLWLDNGLEKERQFVEEQRERRHRHIEESTDAFRATVPKSAPAASGPTRRAPPHHLPKLGADGGPDSAGNSPQRASMGANATVSALSSPSKSRSGKDALVLYTDPEELHDPHRPLRKSMDGSWVEQRRAADHRLYFFNKRTKAKTWDVMETPFATMPFIDPNAVDLTQATDEESIRQLRDQRLRDPNRPLRKIGRWLERRRPNDNALFFMNFENKSTTTKVDETPFAKMPFEDYTAEESLKELEKEAKEKAKYFDINRPLRTCPHWAEERDDDGNIVFVNEKKITKNVDETPFAFLSLDDGVRKLTQAEKIMAQSHQQGALDMPTLWNLTALPPMQSCHYVSEEERGSRTMDPSKDTPAAIRAAKLQRQSKKHFAMVQDMFQKAQTRSLYARGRMQADPPADYMLGTDILRYIPAEVLAKDDPADKDGGLGLIGDVPNNGPADTVFLTATDGHSPSRTQQTDLGGDLSERRQQEGGMGGLLDTAPNTGGGSTGKGLKWKKWNPDAWMQLPEPNKLKLNDHREPEEEAATLTWYKNYHEQYTKVKKRTEHHGKHYSWKRSDRHELPKAKNIEHDKD